MVVFRQLLALVMLAFLSASAYADPKPVIDDIILREAETFEATLAQTTKTVGKQANGWRSEGIRSKTSNPRAAAGAFAASVVLDKASGETWLLLARAYLAIETDKYPEKTVFKQNAAYAAVLAYARSTSPSVKAQALAALADSYGARSQWRPALKAYKASLALAPNTEVQTQYDDMFKQHGFRMLDYTSDNESSNPRICVQFSENLGKSQGDFANFVTLNNEKPAAVRVSGSQLCVEELQHGKRYTVKIRSGLPSYDDDLLPKPVDVTVYIRDRKPLVRFNSQNYVLPRTGQQGIPVVSINTEAVYASIYRIGDRNLASEVLDGDFSKEMNRYQLKQIADQKGEKLWSGSMPVKSKLNEEVTTAFPVDELLPNLKPGLYVMSANAAPVSKKTEGEYDSEDYQTESSQWFVVSDLGLTAFSGHDGIHVYTRSLTSASPVGNVEVRLVARNNDVLDTAKTDTDGAAVFASALTRGEGGLAPALVVARNVNDTDYGFLDLTKQAFDLSDRGVDGLPAAGPLDAFVFTERGVYRGGETVAVTAILRDGNANAVTNTPLIAKLYRPDGVEFKRETLPDLGLGGHSWQIPLPQTAMTGTWRVSVFVDPKGAALYDRSFLVEDYVPERLEMKLTASQPDISETKAGIVHLWGRFLYGAAASNLSTEGEIVVSALNEHRNFPGYRIGQESETFANVRKDLENLPVTDATGAADISVPLPELAQTTKPLTASVTLRLREPSGRALTDRVTLNVETGKSYIGVKPGFEGSVAQDAAAYHVISIGADGKQSAEKGVKWTLTRIDHAYQWYARNSHWSYEAVTYENKVAEGAVDTLADKAVRIERKLDAGNYRLDVASASPQGPATSLSFYSGWYVSADADTPEILDLALDKDSYKAGDDVKVQILPHMAGQALVTIVSDKVLATKLIPVDAGGGSTTFKADASWGSGAYVSAILYRPMDSAAKRMPTRAVGVKWLPLETKSRELSVGLETIASVRPDGPVTVTATVPNLPAGEKASLVVSGVDLGILNITHYKTPEPEGYFLGQRRLGLEMRDIYGKLIDGMQGVRGQIRSGGDAGGLDMSARPSMEKPLAVYSGIVEVGADGKAKVTFTLPPFNGTMRLSAQAWTATKLGHGEKDVIVRDTVVAETTLPKFLTIGDTTTMNLSIENVEAQDGSYRLTTKAEGAVQVTADADKAILLERNKRVAVNIPIKAITSGEGKLSFAITGPDNVNIERSYKLDVGSPAPHLSRAVAQTLLPTTGTLQITADLLKDLTPQSAKVAATVSRTASFDVPGLLIALSRYPYGCAEQTTSRALPLLYFNEVAAKTKIHQDSEIKPIIEKAIARLYEMQSSSGAFSLWGPGGTDNMWLTAYVTDFLARAKEKGFPVRDAVYDLALERLKNTVTNANDFESGGEDLAYGLYVLARTGRGVLGDLRYYADTKIDAFSTPLARAQIAASLAMMGDKERAEQAFRSALTLALKPEPATPNGLVWRSDYGTRLRDAAALVALMGETGLNKADWPKAIALVKTLRAKQAGATTQEQLWLLLAARALDGLNKDLELDVNGAAVKGGYQATLTPDDLAKGPVQIVNKSSEGLTASLVISGDGTQLATAEEKGWRIERKTYTPDGKETPFDRIGQNDRIVVVLKATEIQPQAGEIIVEDRLPAGFDIENPKLLKGADLKAFSWLPDTFAPEFSSFRDDRFVAAFSLTDTSRTEPAQLVMAYVIRAVTPGVYTQAGARVEDMYRPDRYARTAGKIVEVTPAQ